MRRGVSLILVLWACVAQLAAGEDQNRPAAGVHPLRCPRVTVKQRKVVRPTYPEEALRRGIRGTVIVELIIDKQGLPRNIRVIKGDPILVNPVLDAVQQWRWQPYRINHKPVEAELTIAVNFEPARHAGRLASPLFAGPVAQLIFFP